MQIDPKSAEASLADIDLVVARLKQSTYYRGASTTITLWGAFVAIGYLLDQSFPRQAGLIWVCVNVLAFAMLLVIGWRQRRAGAHFDWRIAIAILLAFGFGLFCCGLGHFGARELNVFWPILFMFGYALAGLWLGRAFTYIGVGVAVLAYAGYLFVDNWFQLYLAVVNGGGLMLAGLWLRRA
jgi:hypothetical protein